MKNWMMLVSLEESKYKYFYKRFISLKVFAILNWTLFAHPKFLL